MNKVFQALGSFLKCENTFFSLIEMDSYCSGNWAAEASFDDDDDERMKLKGLEGASLAQIADESSSLALLCRTRPL